MTDPARADLVEAIARRLLARRQWLAVAESCTGGLLAQCLTGLPGSSGWFERGLVTYSNRAKQDLLGVPEATIERFGAVSRESAEAMAAGLLALAPVDWTVAITGVAGPTGGSATKPVGLVWIAWAQRGDGPTRLERPVRVEAQEFHFPGTRAEVRERAAQAALDGLLGRLA